MECAGWVDRKKNLTPFTFSESVQTWMALGMRRAVFSLVMEQMSFKRTVSWHPHGNREWITRGGISSQAKSIHVVSVEREEIRLQFLYLTLDRTSIEIHLVYSLISPTTM